MSRGDVPGRAARVSTNTKASANRSADARKETGMTPDARYLHHVTMTTGHVRRSVRAEISAEALAVCRELLDTVRAGRPLDTGAPIPGLLHPSGQPYHLVLADDPSSRCLLLAVTAARGQRLVTLGLAGHSRCGARLWRALHTYAREWALPVATDAGRCPPEPWAAALLDADSPQHLAVLPALGDLERCLGWAWFEMISSAKTT
jgi:hypothetical protein